MYKFNKYQEKSTEILKKIYEKFYEIDKNKTLLDFNLFLIQQIINADEAIINNYETSGKVFAGIEEGLFTNKLDVNGNFIDKTLDNLGDLLENTKITVNFVSEFLDRYSPKEINNIKIYRSINVGESVKYDIGTSITQNIPFSCSWNYQFVTERWQFDPCCVLEINIPNNYNYLTLSLPINSSENGWITIDNPELRFNNSRKNNKVKILNQPQYELLMMPSKLTIVSIRKTDDGETTILECVAQELQMDEIEKTFYDAIHSEDSEYDKYNDDTFA